MFCPKGPLGYNLRTVAKAAWSPPSLPKSRHMRWRGRGVWLDVTHKDLKSLAQKPMAYMLTGYDYDPGPTAWARNYILTPARVQKCPMLGCILCGHHLKFLLISD